jgi:glycosyltransferase involved in cell wall biosynthesis
MNSNPTSSGVAVIIPAYRSEPWVVDAVRSALGQTRPPDEIVVVDDGSPQSLEPALEPFLDRIIFARQDNRGPGAARNTGVALTSAPLLAFLDADDLWEPQKLASQTRFLAEHEDLVMACSDYWVFGVGRETRRRIGKQPPAGNPDLSLEGIVRDNLIATLTVVIRREAFVAAGGFDESRDLIAVEDFDLWLRVAELGKIGYQGEALARYRRTNSSLSHPLTFLAGVQRVLDKAASRWRGGNELRAVARERKAQLLCDLAWHRLEANQAGGAIEPILEALAMSPRRWLAWKLLARAVLQRIPLASRAVVRP